MWDDTLDFACGPALDVVNDSCGTRELYMQAQAVHALNMRVYDTACRIVKLYCKHPGGARTFVHAAASTSGFTRSFCSALMAPQPCRGFQRRSRVEVYGRVQPELHFRNAAPQGQYAYPERESGSRGALHDVRFAGGRSAPRFGAGVAALAAVRSPSCKMVPVLTLLAQFILPCVCRSRGSTCRRI